MSNRVTAAWRTAPRVVLPHSRPVRRKKPRPSTVGGLFTLGVITALLAVSLTHLADGIRHITGDNWTLSALFAIGIDLGIVASEISLIVSAGTQAAAPAKPWALLAVTWLLVLSATLNALSNTRDLPAYTFQWWAGLLLAITIPVSVFALSKVACELLTKGGKPLRSTRKR